jgi:hypothetical protein
MRFTECQSYDFDRGRSDLLLQPPGEVSQGRVGDQAATHSDAQHNAELVDRPVFGH